MASLQELINNDERFNDEFKSNLVPQEQPEGRGFLGTVADAASFIAEDVTSGATRNEEAPFINQLGADVFQASLGSRGITGVVQNLPKALATTLSTETSTGLSNSLGDLAQTNTRLAEEIRDERDPTRLARLQKQFDSNQETIGGIQSQRDEFDERFIRSGKQVLGTTGNAALTVGSAGFGATGAGTAALARVPALSNTSALTRTVIGEGALGLGFGFTDAASRDADATAGEVAFSVGASVLIPVVGSRISNVVRRVRAPEAAAVSEGLEAVSSTINSNVDALIQAGDSTVVNEILGRDLDNALRALDGNQASEFKKEILDSISGLQTAEELSTYTESLSRLLNLRAVDEIVEPLTDAAQLDSIKVQKQELEDQILEVVGRENADQVEEFISNSDRIDELSRRVASFEGIPQGSLSQLQVTARRNATTELAELTARNAELLPGVQQNLPTITQLRARISELTSLETGIANRAAVAARVPSVINEPGFVSQELDDIVFNQITKTGQEIERKIPNPRRLADGSAQRSHPYRAQQYDKKADRRGILKGIADGFNSTFESLIRKAELNERLFEGITDDIAATAKFHLRPDALGGLNRFDQDVFRGPGNSIAGRIQKLANTLEGQQEVQNDLSVYLLAKHAPFVNAKKGDLPGQVKELIDLEDISNVPSDEIAAKIIAHLDTKYAGNEVFFGMADDIRIFNKGKLRSLVDNKLINAKFARQLENDYPWYVPLYRDISTPEIDGFVYSTGKIDNTIKTLYGSELNVLDVVESSLIKGQKINKAAVDNGVRQTYGRQIAEGIKQDIEVFKQFDIKEVKPGDLVPNDNKSRFNFFGVDGTEFVVSHPDSDLIKPFLFAGVEETGLLKALNFLGIGTRLFGRMLTQYNPAFKVASFVRDSVFESMIIHDGIGGRGALSPAKIKRAMGGIKDFQRGLDTPRAQVYKNAIEDGLGFGTYSAFLNSNSKFEGGVSEALKKSRRIKTFGAIDNLNEILENATRFAHYSQALEQGATRLQATSLAKEAGINFSKQGKASAHINNVYVFFGATIQSNKKIAQAMTNPKTALKVATITTAAATSVEIINSSIEPDWRDKIDKFILDSNVVILTGLNADGSPQYFSIPVPISIRPLWLMENNGIRYEKGDVSAATATFEVIEEFVNVMNPTGGRVTNDERGLSFEEIGTSIVPTLGRPAANVIRNRNFFGSNIIPEDSDGIIDLEAPLVDSFGDDYDEAAALKMAELIEAATGGLGKWSDPRAIKELIRGYAYLGVAKEGGRAVELIDDLIKGNEITPNNIPIVSKFKGEGRDDTQFARDFYKLQEDIRLTDDPELQKQIMFDQVLRDTTEERLGFSPRKKLINSGISVPDIFVGGFTNRTSNAEFALYLSQVHEDDETEQRKELYKKVLSRTDPVEYKRYVEFEAAAKGILTKSDDELIDFFADRGITLTKQKRSGTINRKFMEDKFFTLKRIQSDNPAVQNTYDSFSQVQKEIANRNTPSLEDMREITTAQAKLVEGGYLSQDTYETKRDAQFKQWNEGVGRDLTIEFETNAIDIRELAERAESYNSPLITRYVRDYLTRNGYDK